MSPFGDGDYGDKVSNGRHKSWVWERTSWGNFLGFVLLIAIFCFEVWERSIPHRQCWEQERTTCSGGWVNTNNCGNPQMLKNV